MSDWTRLLAQHYNTDDTTPMVRVENTDLYIRQGDDLIVLDVGQFGLFTDGVWAVIAASHESARIKEATK